MGNCLAPCSLHGAPKARSKRVLQIVKMDGKILEFKAPVLVRDILVKFPGVGIGLSKSDQERLPPDYELKLGKVYYFLRPSSSAVSTGVSTARDHNSSMAGAVKRIKVVITKQQLQQLLSKEVTMEEFLSGQKRQSYCIIDESTNWKPKLESIPEGIE